MLPPMIRAVLALLLAASPLGAGMVDREPAAEPASTLINAHSPRVVASEIGMFLAGGQRVTVDGALQLSLSNPRRRWLMARYEAGEGGGGGDCVVSGGEPTAVDCRFPSPGTYRVRLFVGRQQYGSYDGVGELQAHSR